MIVGHGVPADVLGAIDARSREFFALPDEEKNRYARVEGVYRGFTASQGSALAASRDIETPPDLCELFTVNRFDDPEVARRAGYRPGREAFFAPNVWPERPAGFRDAYEAYYAVMTTQ